MTSWRAAPGLRIRRSASTAVEARHDALRTARSPPRSRMIAIRVFGIAFDPHRRVGHPDPLAERQPAKPPQQLQQPVCRRRAVGALLGDQRLDVMRLELGDVLAAVLGTEAAELMLQDFLADRRKLGVLRRALGLGFAGRAALQIAKAAADADGDGFDLGDRALEGFYFPAFHSQSLSRR